MFSEEEVSFQIMRFIGVYGCVSVGQSSSSEVMGIIVVTKVDILLPGQVSEPPSGWKSAAISVNMLRVIMEGQIGPR